VTSPEPCSLAVTERTGSETAYCEDPRRGTRPLRAYLLWRNRLAFREPAGRAGPRIAAGR